MKNLLMPMLPLWPAAMCCAALSWATPAWAASQLGGKSGVGHYRGGVPSIQPHGRHAHGRHASPRRSWGGSVWLGPSWGQTWGYAPFWRDPWASISYRHRGVGVVIPVLPLGYRSLWVGGEPYYEADDVYYRRVPGGYRVVAPPEGEHRTDDGATASSGSPISTFVSPTDELVIAPERGQSATQRAFDRLDCERAAIARTGYEPTAPGAGAVKKAEYVREVSGCLTGKGYSVK